MPIYRLPVEILAAIFHEAQFLIVDKCVLRDLAAVSRDWRVIATGTPSLWSSMKIMPRRPLELAKLELGRSFPHPVDICFNSKIGHHVDLDEAKVAGAYDLIVQNMVMERVRSISIRASKKNGLERHLERLRDVSAPALERLTIVCDTKEYPSHSPGAWVRPPTIPLFEGGPPARLTRLSMVGTSVRYCLPPLQNITTLQLTRQSIPLAVFSRMLSATPSLAHLSLDDGFQIEGMEERMEATGYDGSFTSIASPLLPIHVPSLRVLQVGEILDVWQMISSPGLDTLILGPSNWTKAVSVAALAKSLKSKQGAPRYPDLQYLQLREIECIADDGALPPPAIDFPSITHLGFTFRYFSSGPHNFLSMISPSDDASPPLPFTNLKTLSVALHDKSDFTNLCDLVRKRAAAGAPLAKVRVQEPHRSPWLDETYFIFNSEPGLEVQRLVDVELKWSAFEEGMRLWDAWGDRGVIMRNDFY